MSNAHSSIHLVYPPLPERNPVTSGAIHILCEAHGARVVLSFSSPADAYAWFIAGLELCAVASAPEAAPADEFPVQP